MNVQKPVRYMGGEFNAVMKDADAVDVRYAFLFPDTYEVGMSHLGMKILHHTINKREDAWCERVFSPWVDMADLMRRDGIPLFSLESRTPVKDFDLLGITLALLSVLTWVVYLLITRKVSQEYSAVTQMKWIFLVSSIAVVPFAVGDISQTALLTNVTLNADWWLGALSMLFIVVFATVLGYFMIPYAMQYLKATTVSTYTNLQPVVASLVAIAVGQDLLTWDKPVAALLVLLGAYIVTK